MKTIILRILLLTFGFSSIGNIHLLAMKSNNSSEKNKLSLTAVDLVAGGAIGTAAALEVRNYINWLRKDGLQSTITSLSKNKTFKISSFMGIALFSAFGTNTIIKNRDQITKKTQKEAKKFTNNYKNLIKQEVQKDLRSRSTLASGVLEYKKYKGSAIENINYLYELLGKLFSKQNHKFDLDSAITETIGQNDRFKNFNIGFGIGAALAFLGCMTKHKLPNFGGSLAGLRTGLIKSAFGYASISYMGDLCLSDFIKRIDINASLKEKTIQLVENAINHAAQAANEQSSLVSNIINTEKNTKKEEKKSKVSRGIQATDFCIGIGFGILLTCAWLKYKKISPTMLQTTSTMQESLLSGFVTNMSIATMLYQHYVDNAITSFSNKMCENEGMQLCAENAIKVFTHEFLNKLRQEMRGGNYLIDEKKSSDYNNQMQTASVNWDLNKRDLLSISSGITFGLAGSLKLLTNPAFKKMLETNILVSKITQTSRNWAIGLWLAVTFGALAGDAFLTMLGNVLNTNDEVKKFITQFSQEFAEKFVEECKNEDWWGRLAFKSKGKNNEKNK